MKAMVVLADAAVGGLNGTFSAKNAGIEIMPCPTEAIRWKGSALVRVQQESPTEAGQHTIVVDLVDDDGRSCVSPRGEFVVDMEKHQTAIALAFPVELTLRIGRYSLTARVDGELLASSPITVAAARL